MDIFPEGWASFDHIPMVTNHSGQHFPHPSNQTSEMQNAEWSSFLEELKQEDSAGGSELLFGDLPLEPQAAPGATATTSESLKPMPFQACSSNMFSSLTPPESATHPASGWPSTTTTSYPTSAPSLQQWRPAEMQHHLYTSGTGHEGLYSQMPPTPQTAYIHQGPMMDQMLLQDSPHGLPDMDMQDTDLVLYPTDQRSNMFREDSAGHDGDDEADAVDPCYAKLLYRALMEQSDHTMSLKELYEWIIMHSQKAKDSKSRGWQNSVRHNLSMNKAFEKAPACASQGAKKGSLWRLTNKAIREGVISTTRFRKDPKRKQERRSGGPAPNRQISGSRGGQATRAATRRNRDANQPRSAMNLPPVDHHHHDHFRHGLPFGSPLPEHSNRPSPLIDFFSTPEPSSPMFPPADHLYPTARAPCHRPTPQQSRSHYNNMATSAMQNFELRNIDYATGGLIGDQDEFLPATPAMTTDATLMSDDGMDDFLSPITSRETSFF